ncbi:MAG: formylglycine-generating enzyme family protein [Armatimonadetes bacterium]|nr:formylglycine-generating enzyme family protein [Armatimonadota bacterium]
MNMRLISSIPRRIKLQLCPLGVTCRLAARRRDKAGSLSYGGVSGIAMLAASFGLAAVAPAASERVFPADKGPQVWVPPGEFVMGADDPDAPDRPDERPPHKVTVDGFWMDKFEVTCAQYVAFFNAKWKDKPLKDRLGTCDLPKVTWPESGVVQDRSTGELKVIPGREKWPVLVGWHAAFYYCEAMGKRLPTEAEWEWAVLGSDGRKYPWGNAWDPKKANVGTDKIVAVGSFTGDVSPFGLFDMAGNVREWCADRYEPTYYQQSPIKNPFNYGGTWEPWDRAIRGGGYGFTEWDSRASSRGSAPYLASAPCTGFRCVAGGPPPTAQ